LAHEEANMALQSKVVLITGATGALGHAVARAFAAQGARLALAARHQEELDKLVAALGTPGERAFGYAADLAVSREVQALMQVIATRWRGVDVLLNLVGGWQGGKRLADLGEEEWEATLALNLRSAYLVNRAVLPYMVSNGWGRIVNIASRAAVEPGPRQAAYNVAKAGVVALTASIASDHRRQGVAANVLLPSLIDTPQNRAQQPDADYSRWVKPEELAELILTLCGDAAGSLNGASIPVYGRV
jgi:NAD(P)-dependent dehydrogenase (short-subunit alcohol dehydrogenase family)